MRTVKGLIVLVLVAAALFVVVGLDNIRSQARYAEKLRNTAVAGALATDEPTPTEKTNNAAEASTRTTSETTNVLHQARQQVKKANL